MRRRFSEGKWDGDLVPHHCLCLLSSSFCLCNRIIWVNSWLLGAEPVVLVLGFLLLVLRGYWRLRDLVLLSILGPHILLPFLLLLIELLSLLLLLLDRLL